MGHRRQEADAKRKRKRAIMFALGITALLVLFSAIITTIVLMNL